MYYIQQKFEEFYRIFLTDNKLELYELEKNRQSIIETNNKKKKLMKIFVIIGVALFFLSAMICAYLNYESDDIPTLSLIGAAIAIGGPYWVAKRYNQDGIEYDTKYKKLVIKKIVESFSENLTYSPEGTIKYDEFKEIWKEHENNIFFSSDVISGEYLGHDVEISNINTRSTNRNPNYENFNGIFSKFEMPVNFDGSIYIKRKLDKEDKFYQMFIYDISESMNIEESKKSLKKQYEKLDIDKLKKEFLIYISDFKCKQLFDNQLIQLLEEIAKEQKIEIVVKNNVIYMKLWEIGFCTSPPTRKECSDKETMYNHYKKIYMILNLSLEFEKRLKNIL